jgi:hypothetical protein
MCSTENFEKNLALDELLNEVFNDENVIIIIIDLFNIYDKRDYLDRKNKYLMGGSYGITLICFRYN